MSGGASRLMREQRDVASQQIPVVFAEPEESDIYHWRGLILGPPGTPYCLGLFHVRSSRYAPPALSRPPAPCESCACPCPAPHDTRLSAIPAPL